MGELRDTHGELTVCSCLKEEKKNKKHRRRMLGMLERIFWENSTSAFGTQLVRCCRFPLTVKLLDCYMDWKHFVPDLN